MAQSEGRGLRWPPSKARLKTLIIEATENAYDGTEQRMGFYTLIEDHLALPGRSRLGEQAPSGRGQCGRTAATRPVLFSLASILTSGQENTGLYRPSAPDPHPDGSSATPGFGEPKPSPRSRRLLGIALEPDSPLRWLRRDH